MNPWVDALIRLGTPTAFLLIVLKFIHVKLWPLLLEFIEDARKKAAANERKIEEARQECKAEGKVMMDGFMAALDKRDETGRMQVKQLEVLAETNRRLAQGSSGPLKRKK